MSDLVTVYQLLVFWIESRNSLGQGCQTRKPAGAKYFLWMCEGGVGWGRGHCLQFCLASRHLVNRPSDSWEMPDVGFVHGICFPNAGKLFKLKNKNCDPNETSLWVASGPQPPSSSCFISLASQGGWGTSSIHVIWSLVESTDPHWVYTVRQARCSPLGVMLPWRFYKDSVDSVYRGSNFEVRDSGLPPKADLDKMPLFQEKRFFFLFLCLDPQEQSVPLVILSSMYDELRCQHTSFLSSCFYLFPLYLHSPSAICCPTPSKPISYVFNVFWYILSLCKMCFQW